ncbi:MAG TPA: nuclear transport factor 2 family protein [Sulfuricaulis sp.]|nr:nuclear transport factor 2 family protein [Sulfuricaulis sp.]
MSEKRYDTPQEAEAAFYAAFIKRDVNAMMDVWAADENISCIHPLGQILIGRTAVRDSWEEIFRHSPEVQIMINGRSRGQDASFAIHVVEEHIRAGNEPAGTPMHTTNVYHLTEAGWRMVLHHASPAPPPPKNDSPTLH